MKANLSAQLSRNKRKKEWKLFGSGMLYLIPGFVFFGVFLFYPIVKTLYYSFFSVKGGGSVETFVGFSHYVSLIHSDEFIHSFFATILFVVYLVPSEIIISMFLALIASEKLRGMGLFRTIFSSTLGVSVAAGASIWLFLFNPGVGMLNHLLNAVGLSGVDWLTNSTWALISVAGTTVWMNIGINFILILGGLQNIPQDLYESARIDGAGYWSRLKNVTIPMLSPTLFFVIIIGIIGSFQTFGQIDILTKGGPANATNLIVYSIYEQAFKFGHFGFASAQAIVLFILMGIVTIFQFKFGERRVHYQ